MILNIPGGTLRIEPLITSHVCVYAFCFCVFKQSELIFHFLSRCEAETLTDDSVSRSRSGQNDIAYSVTLAKIYMTCFLGPIAEWQQEESNKFLDAGSLPWEQQ